MEVKSFHGIFFIREAKIFNRSVRLESRFARCEKLEIREKHEHRNSRSKGIYSTKNSKQMQQIQFLNLKIQNILDFRNDTGVL